MANQRNRLRAAAAILTLTTLGCQGAPIPQAGMMSPSPMTSGSPMGMIVPIANVPTPLGPQAVPIVGARNKVEAFAAGVADTGADVIKGITHAILHPVDTLAGIGNSIVHPGITLDNIEYKIRDSFARDPYYASGQLAANIGLIAAPIGIGAKASTETTASLNALKAARVETQAVRNAGIVGGSEAAGVSQAVAHEARVAAAVAADTAVLARYADAATLGNFAGSVSTLSTYNLRYASSLTKQATLALNTGNTVKYSHLTGEAAKVLNVPTFSAFAKDTTSLLASGTRTADELHQISRANSAFTASINQAISTRELFPRAASVVTTGAQNVARKHPVATGIASGAGLSALAMNGGAFVPQVPFQPFLRTPVNGPIAVGGGGMMMGNGGFGGMGGAGGMMMGGSAMQMGGAGGMMMGGSAMQMGGAGGMMGGSGGVMMGGSAMQMGGAGGMMNGMGPGMQMGGGTGFFSGQAMRGNSGTYTANYGYYAQQGMRGAY